MPLPDKMDGKDELIYADGAKHWVENPESKPIQKAPHTLRRIVSEPMTPFVFKPFNS